MIHSFLLKANLTYYVEIISSLNLLALFGALTIWFLNRKKERDKVRYEEKKQIKRILFILLEIRLHLITHLKIEKFSTIYASVMKEKVLSIIKDVGDVSENSISEFIKPIIEKMFNSLKGDDKSLLEQFNFCIESLCEIDPLLSYRINGKQNIRAYLNTWEDSLKDYHEKYDEEASEEDFNKFMSIVKPNALEAIILDFDEMIKEVANLVSKKTKEKTVPFLETENEDTMKKDMKLEIDLLFDGLKNQFGK